MDKNPINQDFCVDKPILLLYSYSPSKAIAGRGEVASITRDSQKRPFAKQRFGFEGVNMRRTSVWWVALAVLALLVNAGAAMAQDVTATITGTVTDATGAAVVGATATAKSVERGTTYTGVTN